MSTIDALTKGGTLESGTIFKKPLETTPKNLGMDRGDGQGDQKVPKPPVRKLPGGFTIK